MTIKTVAERDEWLNDRPVAAALYDVIYEYNRKSEPITRTDTIRIAAQEHLTPGEFRSRYSILTEMLKVGIVHLRYVLPDTIIVPTELSAE